LGIPDQATIMPMGRVRATRTDPNGPRKRQQADAPIGDLGRQQAAALESLAQQIIILAEQIVLPSIALLPYHCPWLSRTTVAG